MVNAPDIVTVKNELQTALGENFSLYLDKLKQWFHAKMTKEEFDLEARKFLTSEKVQIHNRFLLALLNRANFLPPTSAMKDASIQNKDRLKKGKLKKKPKLLRTTFEQRFHPSPVSLYAPQAVAKENADENKLTLCSREGLLPDVAMIHGRMFIIAWECGLDTVDDEAVKLMVLAVQNEMRSLIMSVLSKRNAYRLRENRFQYAVGCPDVNIYLQNAQKVHTYSSNSNATSVSVLGEHVPNIRPTIQWAESEAALEMACDNIPRKRRAPVSAYDLFDTLKVHKSNITSHTVYATNMERISACLYHPSTEELEQENICDQEEKLRAYLETEIMS